VPFVIIQVIMVGLIIFFPGIVSSGLDKEVKVDLDQVQMQMEADSKTPEMPVPDAPQEAASAPTADDSDPMKAMQDSMDKDSGTKK
jgi:GntP family gluconate:H+ symporter